MSTELFVAKLIDLTRYQIDIIDELINELLIYRDIDEIETMYALQEAKAIREEIGDA